MISLPRRDLLLSAFLTAASASLVGRALADDAALDRPLLELYSGLEAAMKSGKTVPFPQRFAALAPVVDKSFDLEAILKVSVGLRWDAMDAATQAKLLKTFRSFTIATYVANFDRYDGQKFRILPGARDSGSDRIVQTEMVPTSGDTVRLDYVMREENGSWRAVDVLLDGSISRVAVQRSDFRKLLAGGDADALINSLRRKINDLSDGALNS
jgi:phospholipid transport system substrate-binding protein